jgi:uncharacterized membrane protein
MFNKAWLNADQKKQVEAAIKEAELNTSGEVRVHIDGYCKEEVLDKASFWFEKLNMHKTQLRNGVLFYLAINDRKFAILGDAGINAKVAPDFWDTIKDKMQLAFKNGNFTEGLVEGILTAGMQLKTHFPYQSDDKNELNDEVSYG